ncbi:hypothetical protein ACN22W_09425 [Burkholderia theae]|uniref:hypothetical protein n=1 Tax=Burkholderia theae TaxID=3143496 RepID=UPI003AFB5F24
MEMAAARLRPSRLATRSTSTRRFGAIVRLIGALLDRLLGSEAADVACASGVLFTAAPECFVIAIAIT